MTKIDIFSGFLGAGKTTLIKKLIDQAFSGEKIVLIENEFGEVGIDGGFLKDAGIEITEMNSGCICCTLVGDFAKSMREVMERFAPDRILIEPSGVGKLSDVMASVIDMEKEADVKLNALVTVVNAKKARKQMKAFGEFFNNQIEHATTLVLSRTSEIDTAKVEEAVELIKGLNQKAALITTPWEEIDGKKILAAMEGQDNLEMKTLAELHHKADAEAHEHEHHHGHGDHDHHDHDHDHHDHDHDDHDGHDHDHGHGDHDHDDHDHDHDGHEGHDHGDHDHDDHDHEDHDHDHGDHDHDHGDHDHEGHDHGHDHGDHDHEGHGHDHHDHDHEGHDHGHDHGDHDHEGHDHHDHEGHGHGHHHHHHHADEIFDTWGIETPHIFEKETIEAALKAFSETEEYGYVIRSKGMVPSKDGSWIYFDLVEGDYELRSGEPDYTGRLVVIGTGLQEEKIKEIFGL